MSRWGITTADGGGVGIRTLDTGNAGITVFETAAFDHSATPPKAMNCAGSCVKKDGGEAGIRTPDTLLRHTRFPIVLLRPARTPLRFQWPHATTAANEQYSAHSLPSTRGYC